MAPSAEEDGAFVGVALPVMLEQHDGPQQRSTTATAEQKVAMDRVEGIRRAAYYYADELASHLAAGASNDGGDGVVGSGILLSAGVGHHGYDHNQSQALHNTFTAIGDMATALAHYYTTSRDAKGFSIDMSSSCYLLAIQVNGMSRRELCPLSVYKEVVACLMALDDALGAVAAHARNVPSSSREACEQRCRDTGEDAGAGDQDEMAPLPIDIGGAGGLSMEPTLGHASNSSEAPSLPRDAAMLSCLCATSQILQRILKLMHVVCFQRHSGLFENVATLLHQSLLLPSHEDARSLTWFMAMALGLSVAFIFLEATLLFSRDNDKMVLVVPGVMVLAPLVAAAATRIVVPRWVQCDNAITKTVVSCVCSLALSLALMAIPPTRDGVASNTRSWGVTVAYMVAAWRVAGSPAAVGLSVLLYCFGALLQLGRGSTDVVVQYLVTAGSLGAVLATGVAVLYPMPQLHVGSLRCARRMMRAMAHTAGVQLLQNGLFTPLWQAQQQQQQMGRQPRPDPAAVANTTVQPRSGVPAATGTGGSSGTIDHLILASSVGAAASGSVFHLGALMEHVARDYGLGVRIDGRVKAVQGNVEAAASVLALLFSSIANLKAQGTARGLLDSSSTKGSLLSSLARTGGGPAGVPQTVVVFRMAAGAATGNATGGGYCSLWCQDMQHIAPSVIAAARSASESSGLALLHTRDHGLALRFRTCADGSGLQLHMAVSPNQGDETVLIVHPSTAVQWTLAQLMWEHGIATCVQQEFEPTADMNVSTFSGVLLPMDMFCEGALVDEVDLPTLFPFAYIGALDLTEGARGGGGSRPMPPAALPDSLHITLRGLPSHANASQYHRFVMEVRLRSATKYPLQQPTVFHNPAPMRKLGQGSVGVVHKVRLEDGTMVAMKIMRSKLLANYNLDTLHCLEEERRKMDLQHPNILNVLHAEQHAIGTATGDVTQGSRGGEVVVYMELCSNVNLRSLLQCGPLSYREASRITLQLLCGLEYLHRHRSYAGDLKSENILFGPLRRVKIADYCSTFTTLHWRAPEFRDAAPQSPEEREQADVWALGCVQLEILFGRDYVPFASSPVPPMPPTSPHAATPGDVSAPSSMEPAPAQRLINPLLLRGVQAPTVATDGPPVAAVSGAPSSVQFVPSSVCAQSSFQLEAILPPHMHHDWRSFIVACLQREPSRRAKLDGLCGHRFVNGVGLSELLPMSSDERAQFDTLRAGPHGGARSQSSGGGGSSVNWPKAEAGDD